MYPTLAATGGDGCLAVLIVIAVSTFLPLSLLLLSPSKLKRHRTPPSGYDAPCCPPHVIVLVLVLQTSAPARRLQVRLRPSARHAVPAVPLEVHVVTPGAAQGNVVPCTCDTVSSEEPATMPVHRTAVHLHGAPSDLGLRL